MALSTGRRAVNAEQKRQRRRAILDAALALFQKSDYGSVSVAAVAREAGIAKGTVYLYFDTKEELFLALQARAFADWFDAVDEQLQAQLGGDAVPAVVDVIVSSLTARPTFVQLVAILHAVLEQNIGRDTARQFKTMLLRRVGTTGALLEARLPFLREGDGARVLLRLHALVIGLQHLAAPAPVVRKVLEQNADLQVFDVDFQASLTDTLTALLYGLHHQHTDPEP